MNYHIFEQTIFTLYNTQNVFFSKSENENPDLYKNGGRSAMLQIFPRGRSAMKGGDLQCCKPSPWGKVCNVADLPGGRSAIQYQPFSI